ncbi:MAG: hypothetical protein V4612_00305 [Pseudomonadota bacterium]
MIRNILYSLFLHSILILLVYFSFNFSPPPEVEKTSKIAISFVVKAGNSDNVNQAIKAVQTPAPAQAPKEVLPPQIKPTPKAPEEKPIKKKSKPKPQPEKPLPKPKAEAKKEQAKAPPKQTKPKEKEAKTEANKVKEPNKKPDAKQEPEKPKEEKKKPEVKEEVKKEPADKKVEEKPAAQTPAEEDEEDVEESELNQYSFTENTIESLDLLAREKFNIQSQIKRCYKKALDLSGSKNKTVINAHIVVGEDGFIDLSEVIIKDFQKYTDPKEVNFHQAVDVVIQSLKLCSPIRNLPQDKYDVWKEIDLQFDGE